MIYLDDNGRIAHDKKNGARKNVLDATGNAVIEDFSAQKINQIKQDALMIMGEVTEGDYVKFDALVEEYSQDTEMLRVAPNGLFVTATTNYDSPEVIKALFEMKDGEIRLVQSEFGFHVVMRYELGEKPYENEENSAMFINSETGEYVFMEELQNKLFSQYLAPYAEKVVVNEELLSGVDIKNAGVNMNY